MQNYNKAIAAFLGSAVALLGVFGIHTGLLSDPTVQNGLATVLAVLVPTLSVIFAPSNKPVPAPVPAQVSAATASAAATVAAQAAQEAARAASALIPQVQQQAPGTPMVLPAR